MYNAVAMQPISSKFIKQVRIRESLGARWPIVGPIWVFNVGPNLDPDPELRTRPLFGLCWTYFILNLNFGLMEKTEFMRGLNILKIYLVIGQNLY